MTTYPTKKNFIKNGDELLGGWAHVGHHVVATAHPFVNGVVVSVQKTFDSRNAILNRSQAIRWILQTANATNAA